MIHKDLTSTTLESCFEVSNELGIAYLESVYERALAITLRQKKIACETQVPLAVNFRGVTVGNFIADMVVDGKVLLELKAVKMLTKEHYAQILKYLKTTGISTGLVVNFGTTRIQYRRFDNRFLESSQSPGSEL